MAWETQDISERDDDGFYIISEREVAQLIAERLDRIIKLLEEQRAGETTA